MFPFLPRGLAGMGMPDPDQFADEFLEAVRVAQSSGPFQFTRDAFPDADVLTPGNHVRILHDKRQALLQTVAGIDPVISSPGTPEPYIFQIPYNQGFAEIDPMGDGDVAQVWTSEYPELVVAFYSYQYIRLDVEDFPGYDPADDTTWHHIRVQVALTMDGARIPGTGPYANAPATGYRGGGLGQRSARPSVVMVQAVPAGPHRVAAVAAQLPSVKVSDDTLGDPTKFLSDPPVSGVVIGSRRLIVLTAARGTQLRS